MSKSAAFSVFLLSAVTVRAAAGDELLDRVRSSYPSALKILEGAYSQVHGSGHKKVTIPIKPSGERVITTSFTMAVDGLKQRVVEKTEDRSPERSGFQEAVECVNEKYSFVLKRSVPDAPYLLTGVVPERGEANVAELGSMFRNALYAPFSVENLLISRMIAQTGFRFIGANLVQEQGRELIRIQFESTDPKAEISAGVLWVDPSDGWMLQRSEYYVHPSRKRLFRSTVDYAKENERSVPKQVNILEPSLLRREYWFDSIKFEGSPEGDFRLPAFGLPELSGKTGADPSQNHMGTWFIGLGVASLIAALGFRYFARRGRA